LESKKDLKKLFPHLFKELEGSENKVKIDSIRKDPQEAEAEVAALNETNPDADIEYDAECEVANTELELEVPQQKTDQTPPPPDKFRNYNPTVVDFLRRCDTCEQAEEIIAYMCKKGELTEENANQLRTQLKKDGVRSFGPKKETDYYFKESGLY
jgi:hypothetical protein